MRALLLLGRYVGGTIFWICLILGVFAIPLRDFLHEPFREVTVMEVLPFAVVMFVLSLLGLTAWILTGRALRKEQQNRRGFEPIQ